jgi:methyl-accepting chemotaxis protein
MPDSAEGRVPFRGRTVRTRGFPQIGKRSCKDVAAPGRAGKSERASPRRGWPIQAFRSLVPASGGLKRMKIRNRLLLNFSLLLALMLAGFLFSMIAAYREHQTKITLSNAYEVAMATENIRNQTIANHLALSNYLITGTPAELNNLNAGNDRIAELLNAAKSKTDDPSLLAGMNRIEAMEHDWYTTIADRFVQDHQQVENGKIKPMDLLDHYTETGPTQQLQRSNQVIDEVQKEDSDLIKKSQDESESMAHWILIIDAIGFLAALCLGAYISLRTSNSITDPLEKIGDAALAIGSKGDLDQNIAVDGTDEIGALAQTLRDMVVYFRELAAVSESIAGGDLSVEVTPRSDRDVLNAAFSQMTSGLRALVRSVRDAAAQVSAGSNQVADASEDTAKNNLQSAAAIDEVTSTMHEMSINVQNMVKSTQMQASSVSETSASIDQMVASIQRVADSARVLLDISARSRDEVTSGIETMQKTTDGLNRINTSILSSATTITSLGQMVDDIGKIVEVIDDISEQTNLLALNAAIEAARAGEHGLGFAVVADEVRKLAEKSATSTKEIGELISSIQSETRSAVGNMENSTTIVNQGLELGSNLSLALHKISNVVTEVFNYAQEIGAATNEQSNGSSQIARATSRLNEITHEISSAVEEQAGGAQAVVRAMERMREMVQQSSSSSTELAASAEQMSKMARSLLESMDRFVLEDHHQEKPHKLNGTKYALAGSHR